MSAVYQSLSRCGRQLYKPHRAVVQRLLRAVVKNIPPICTTIIQIGCCGAYAEWGGKMAAGQDPLSDDELTRTVWNRIVDSAEQFNEPGVFTALHGFEWTSSPEANNLHRVVIFRDNADKVRDLVPFSNYDSSDPEDLWSWLQAYQDDKEGKVFAIPHNGNLSNGLMFDDTTLDGKALTADYAERRSLWEPLYEVTQIKGDGETHPALSANDEFADYWRWDKGNFGLYGKQPDMLPREYARQALMRGLKYEASLGANPFKFGLVERKHTRIRLGCHATPRGLRDHRNPHDGARLCWLGLR